MSFPTVFDGSGMIDATGNDDPHIIARACDACRRMKIRCIGKETPPCKRCRSQALPCKFEMGARKSSTTQGDGSSSELAPDRLQDLEKRLQEVTESVELRFGGLDRKLDGLLHHLQASAPPPNRLLEGAPVPFTSPSHRAPQYPLQPSISPRRSTALASASPSASRSTWHIRSNSTSDDDVDDPITEMMELNPYRSLNKHHLEDDITPAVPQPISPMQVAGKRRRIVTESQSPMRNRTVVMNPVQMGWCTETTARELFASFFSHAHSFMPVFEPTYDTFESISARSALCLTVIIFVASAVRDSLESSQQSQRLCNGTYDSAKDIIGQSLLTHDSDMETLQALVVFASWSDHPWRLGCHALSIARLNMRLYRCLPFLAKQKIARTTSHPVGNEDRRLLAGARVWVAILKLVYEMSFNNGLPLPISDALRESSGLYVRELVDHPSSTLYDSRCVVSLEMLQAREQIYTSYLSSELKAPDDLDAMLRKVNETVRDRKQYWERYYKSVGLTIDHFLVKELRSQEAYAIMYANSCAWVGVHSKGDVDGMSRERKQLVAAAMRAAAFLVQSIGSGSQMKDSEYGNRYFHLGIISTAKYLIRMCELLPEICDLHQISNDLEMLLIKLPHYALPELAGNLRKALSQARASGVLPPHTVDVSSEAPINWPEPSPAKSTPGGQLDISILNQLFPPSVTTSLLDVSSQTPSFDWASTTWAGFDADLPWLNTFSYDGADQATTSGVMLPQPPSEQNETYEWLAQ